MPIPMTPPKRRVLLSDSVYEQLLDAILGGQLLPGEHLRDDEVARWVGTSRTPIREAVASLQRLGIVEVSSNRHTRVAAITVDDAADRLRHLQRLLRAAHDELQTLPAALQEQVILTLRVRLDEHVHEHDADLLWGIHYEVVTAIGSPSLTNAVDDARITARFALSAHPNLRSDSIAAAEGLLRSTLTSNRAKIGQAERSCVSSS